MEYLGKNSENVGKIMGSHLGEEGGGVAISREGVRGMKLCVPCQLAVLSIHEFDIHTYIFQFDIFREIFILLWLIITMHFLNSVC